MNARVYLLPHVVKLRAPVTDAAECREAPRDQTRPGLYTRPGSKEDIDRAARRQVEHAAQEMAALWRRHPFFDHPGIEHGGGSDG